MIRKKLIERKENFVSLVYSFSSFSSGAAFLTSFSSVGFSFALAFGGAASFSSSTGFGFGFGTTFLIFFVSFFFGVPAALPTFFRCKVCLFFFLVEMVRS